MQHCRTARHAIIAEGRGRRATTQTLPVPTGANRRGGERVSGPFAFGSHIRTLSSCEPLTIRFDCAARPQQLLIGLVRSGFGSVELRPWRRAGGHCQGCSLRLLRRRRGAERKRFRRSRRQRQRSDCPSPNGRGHRRRPMGQGAGRPSQAAAQRCARCGAVERRCGGGAPSPSADVGGVSPVPAQMWRAPAG